MPPPSPRAAVERAGATIERPLVRAAGSARANPLPHAGTITVALLVVVTLTGLYITLFYEYGFEASYDAVREIDDHPIQRVMRSLHRYSSAALVLTTLVHAWRMFVSGRFGSGRRWRWLTGVSALVIVWLAGVTGYWLVWDARAQAISESIQNLVGSSGLGAAFMVDRLWGPAASSGAGLTVLVWLLHLGLTALIGLFVWRHVRRTRLAWWPPRFWWVVIVGVLLLLSILRPADLLAPADVSVLVPDMSVDPFILFLLPPLLGGHASIAAVLAAAVIGAVVAVPWVLRERTEPVAVDIERCTGCDICAFDCPYLAIEMVDAAVVRDGSGGHRRLAVVDEEACVACGVCLGSCAFGALTLIGFEPLDQADRDLRGLPVTIACSRQARHLDVAPGLVAHEVRCTAMLGPGALGTLEDAGAASVEIVGCAAGECVYGIGNLIAHERLTGQRRPHPPRVVAEFATEDFRRVDRPNSPGSDLDPSIGTPPRGGARARAAGIVGGSMIAVWLVMLLPFSGEGPGRTIRLLVDHDPGRALRASEWRLGDVGQISSLELRVDGTLVAERELPRSGSRSVGVIDVHLPEDTAEAAQLDVTLHTDRGPVSHLTAITFVEGRRAILMLVDEPQPPGPERGRRVFEDARRGGCDVCHETSGGRQLAGTSLEGIATSADSRVAGLDAEAYLRESILEPDAHVAEGFRAGQMLSIYDERLEPDEIDALIAYLLTLEAP